VESLDRDALKEWSDCIARDSFCQTTIDFCAIDKPPDNICGPPGIPDNLDDTFALELSIIRGTGQQMRNDWLRAREQRARARALLLGVGVRNRPVTALPRADAAVAHSLFGRA
jgi:hypothetical protein